MSKFKFCPKCGSNLNLKQIRSHQRLVCGACGYIFFENPKPAAGVFIIENGKVLLAKRAIEPFRDYWDSIGGFVEEGESIQETAVRETKEETGLDVKITEIFGAGKDMYGDQHVVPTALLAEIEGGDMKPQDDVSKLKWFDLANLPENIAFNSNKRALEKLKKKFLK